MQIFHHLDEWITFRKSLPLEQSLGFVPTMGNLHAGHLSLYAQARQENDLTLASIFVNPTQFNRTDDFSNYPRTLKADLHLLEQTGVHYCLLPTEQEIYSDSYCYQLQETELCQLMEGKYRPNHFTGVLTIVMKLLNLAKPQRAYFGEKDYQQYLLIRGMVKAFFMDIEIKVCPTIREASGLACSSRNNRLDANQRSKAELFAHLFHQDKSSQQLIEELEQAGIPIEYLEEYANRRFAAVTIDDIRLIDNYAL